MTLRFCERSLYDCRPLSLFGNAAVRALGEEMGRPMDRRRFRANFYADWAMTSLSARTVIGRTPQVGERLRIMALERDLRCKMITLDPDTGAMDASVMRHVAQAHDGKGDLRGGAGRGHSAQGRPDLAGVASV